jgi:hypothetical protein
MSSGLHQIATYPSLIPAQLAHGRLEAAGIASFLTNELGSAAGGGVGLQVAEADAERALELLGGSTPGPEPGGRECLMCRSSDLEPLDWPLPLRLLRAILLMVVPLPTEWFTGRTARCGNCGYEQPLPEAR